MRRIDFDFRPGKMGMRQALYDFSYQKEDGAYVWYGSKERRLEDVLDMEDTQGKKTLKTKEEWREYYKGYIWALYGMAYIEDGKAYVGKYEKKRRVEDVVEEVILKWKKKTGDTEKEIREEIHTFYS